VRGRDAAVGDGDGDVEATPAAEQVIGAGNFRTGRSTTSPLAQAWRACQCSLLRHQPLCVDVMRGADGPCEDQ